MTAVAFDPDVLFFRPVPKSKLLHSPEAQYGFVPKHSLHGGKNIALRAEKPYLSMRSLFRLEKPVFLLSLISKHEMLRMVLVMANGSLLTVRQHQQQTQIL